MGGKIKYLFGNCFCECSLFFGTEVQEPKIWYSKNKKQEAIFCF